MKTINFNLLNPVRITPLYGSTSVSVSTDGDVLISSSSSDAAPRERSVTIADTGKATLTRSPKGLNRTVKITLPITEASETEFHQQVAMLFQIAALNRGEWSKV